MTRAHVMIDADGTVADYLLLIVAAPTGVHYQHQCGGYACLQLSQEGFLVQVGAKDSAERLFQWFWKHFKGNCMNATAWKEEHLVEELGTLVSTLPCYHTNEAGEDTRHFLQLDRGRMDECVEAWIPVHSPYGPGILVLDNSD